MPKAIRAGPTLTDTIHAKKIAAILKRNPPLQRWVVQKLRTKKGRRDLISLLRIEGCE